MLEPHETASCFCSLDSSHYHAHVAKSKRSDGGSLHDPVGRPLFLVNPARSFFRVIKVILPWSSSFQTKRRVWIF